MFWLKLLYSEKATKIDTIFLKVWTLKFRFSEKATKIGKKSPNILTLLCRVREKVNIFSQFLKAFPEYICINFKVQISWENHKDLSKPYILHLLSKRNLNITPLQLHSCNKRCTTDNFPSTGRKCLFYSTNKFELSYRERSQIFLTVPAIFSNLN